MKQPSTRVHPPHKGSRTLVDAATAELCSPILVVGHNARALPFPTAENDSPQAAAFLTAVASATRIIRLQSPNLNEPAMIDALVAAVRRGVEVDLLVSKSHEQSGESLPGRGGPNDATLETMVDTLGASATSARVLVVSATRITMPACEPRQDLIH